jgi:hypothetical protein
VSARTSRQKKIQRINGLKEMRKSKTEELDWIKKDLEMKKTWIKNLETAIDIIKQGENILISFISINVVYDGQARGQFLKIYVA